MKRAVVLIGHGGVPKDCPRELILELKKLEGQRRATGGPVSPQEEQVDETIRNWPRSPENDPYQAGLERLASHLKPLLGERHLVLAYNEFCTPSIEKAVTTLVNEGYQDLTLITTMITPGGSHADREIPETVDHLQNLFPDIRIQYAWPFDLEHVAQMLSEQVKAQGS